MAQTNLHHLCEGVVLYKRAKSKTNCWYGRIKLPTNGRWKKFTTGTDNLEDAKRIALTKLEVTKELISKNIAIDTKRFSHVADYVIKELEQELSLKTGKVTYVHYIRIIKRYKEFFGNKYIGNITYQDLIEYDRERTKLLGHKAKQSTVNLHNVALQRVFDTAVRKGWVHQSQVITFKNDGKKCERRPYFELTEYQKLYRFMRQYVKRTTKDSKKGGVKNRTIQVREMLRDLVLFLVNTGMRFGTESRSLKWKHISEVTINGENYIKINLEKGKTGGRTIIARHTVRRYLNRIKDRFPNLKGRVLGQMLDVEEYIFRLRDGSVPKDLHGAFEIMLDEAELLKDVNGRRRSLYSLRHTYATFAILYSNIDLHLLSKNMGTSIAMLERHYSHLDVLHRADKLAGRSERAKKKPEPRPELDELQTKILIVDGLQMPQQIENQETSAVKQIEEQPTGFADSPPSQIPRRH